MTRAPMLFAVATATALSLSLVTGCDRAADDQQKANNAQAEANKKIGEAKTEAANKSNSAQAEADKKIAAAEADFGKLREDYRHKVQTDLIDLDHKIEQLEAKSKTATGKAKADLDANLAQIRSRRMTFQTSSKSLETATATGWSDTKARIDKEFSDLKTFVDKAA
jgi:hypothetical protein